MFRNSFKTIRQLSNNSSFLAVSSTGPMALLWMGLFFLIQAELKYILSASAISVLAGIIMYGSLTKWVIGPIQMTQVFYGSVFPDNVFNLFFHEGEMIRFFSSIGGQYEAWLSTPILWAYHLPAGQFFGTLGYAFLLYFFKSPLMAMMRAHVDVRRVCRAVRKLVPESNRACAWASSA